jgi:hypothetical protein
MQHRGLIREYDRVLWEREQEKEQREAARDKEEEVKEVNGQRKAVGPGWRRKARKKPRFRPQKKEPEAFEGLSHILVRALDLAPSYAIAHCLTIYVATYL